MADIRLTPGLITLQSVLQFFVAGIQLGGTYALLGVGVSLIFGVMKVVNFAQAEFMMLAMFMTFFLHSSLGIDPLISAAIALPVFGLLGWVVYWGLISRVTVGLGGFDAQVILTLGLGLVIQNVALIVFGAVPRSIRVGYTVTSWRIGDIFVNQARTYALVVSITMVVGLYWFLRSTRTGKALRAVSDHWQAASYMGIDVRRMFSLGFSVGIALTGAGGALLATFYPFDPYVGVNFILIMFVVVVLGGLGSVPGALFGGLIIGVVQSMSQLFVSSALQNVAVFVVFLLVLYLKPEGIFGREVRAL